MRESGHVSLMSSPHSRRSDPPWPGNFLPTVRPHLNAENVDSLLMSFDLALSELRRPSAGRPNGLGD